MTLTAENLDHLCKIAIAGALEAGAYIAAQRPGKLAVQKKEGRDSLASQVVTEVDLQSQKIILAHLKPTVEPFDLALLAEEDEDDRTRLEKPAFWCVDPLDGTLPFIESTDGFSVSIALVARDGTPLIGVVYDPSTATLYHAIKDQGLFRNQKPWEPQTTAPLNRPLTFLTDRSLLHHAHYDQTITTLEAIAADMGCTGVDIVPYGGGVMNALWVLERSPACYFKYPIHGDGGGSLWDYAATACLFAEAKAFATDLAGDPLELNRAESTFMNHRGFVFATDRSLAAKIRRLAESA
jgi:3'-phosphoadenosine 5'-phosphosulfate (PAPS) 3'-phosphatase